MKRLVGLIVVEGLFLGLLVGFLFLLAVIVGVSAHNIRNGCDYPAHAYGIHGYRCVNVSIIDDE